MELTATAQGFTPTSTAGTPSPTAQLPTNTPTQGPTSLPTFTDVPEITSTPQPTATTDPRATPKPPILYYTQAGDTLASITGRFGVSASQITSSEVLPQTGLISPNILLVIPDVLTNVFTSDSFMPDSEVVYSPSAQNFDYESYINQAGGYLSKYVEKMNTGNFTGVQIIRRVALENSINPYLLLALLEFKGHWVLGQPSNLAETEYPMGMVRLEERNLYHQLSWTVQQLNIGYYGWRAGTLYELRFKDGTVKRIDPELNAGSAAIQYLFAQWYDPLEWAGALDVNSPSSMPTLMASMFGNYLIRAQAVEPLYPADLTQPVLELPFQLGTTWGFTGGPHSAWGPDGALAALDFAPPSELPGCVQSNEWVTAMAPGVIVRSEEGLVIEDLDGDGIEQTGWDIMYFHIETRGRIAVGTQVNTGDKIGHPSCEGGIATGTHTHVVRKFNGEWILAAGPLPFTMSGYVAEAGQEAYQGELVDGTVIISANGIGSYGSQIKRR
jgi:murein DD-endopeptidase MepM/ murein hydrolase activator NlpD